MPRCQMAPWDFSSRSHLVLWPLVQMIFEIFVSFVSVFFSVFIHISQWSWGKEAPCWRHSSSPFPAHFLCPFSVFFLLVVNVFLQVIYQLDIKRGFATKAPVNWIIAHYWATTGRPLYWYLGSGGKKDIDKHIEYRHTLGVLDKNVLTITEVVSVLCRRSSLFTLFLSTGALLFSRW